MGVCYWELGALGHDDITLPGGATFYLLGVMRLYGRVMSLVKALKKLLPFLRLQSTGSR
jgi:hypothetical protein